jgi:hypothetical protein
MAKKTQIRYMRPSVMWQETTKAGDFTRRHFRFNSSKLVDRGREAGRIDKERARANAKSRQHDPEQRQA